MAYSLSTSYIGDSLISGFNWFHGDDPSNGYVAYQTQQNASALSLYAIDSATQVVRLGVDSTNKYALDEGRPSIRLESKQAYNHGLFIADFLHMPPSQCGVWPAFWAYGSDWPNGGEIDIIEGANTAYSNIISAHTTDGCYLDPADSGLYSGVQRNQDCAIGTQNIGCGYSPPSDDVSSYGDGFNAASGGVYAMQWDSEYIRVWHFARGSIPADITAKEPNPDGWGLPDALFGGSQCEPDSYFKDMNIVINTNFCGDYGSATWADTCGDVASTCEDYVANNPEAFANAYWDVRYIDVYQASNSTIITPSNGTTTTITVTPTALSTGAATGNSTAATTPFMSASTHEPTTTTTMTSFSTTTVTVPGADATEAPSNPASIGNYSYLGCFGSDTGFRTFDRSKESDAMTLEMCVDSCNGSTYAGVFEGKCYCADSLDANTRAVADQSACDHLCPGDASEFCGGLTDDNQRSNSTLSFRRYLRRRDAPSNYLLTVYAAVSDEEPPAPPAMAAGNTATNTATNTAISTITTTITYMTVAPAMPHTVVAQEYVATLIVEECGCDEPETIFGIPMETKVVACEGCGKDGGDEVTITVPVTVTATETMTQHSVVTAKVQQIQQAQPLATGQAQTEGDSEPVAIVAQVPTADSANTSTSTSTLATPSPSTVLVAGATGGWKGAKLSASIAMVAVAVVGVML